MIGLHVVVVPLLVIQYGLNQRAERVRSPEERQAGSSARIPQARLFTAAFAAAFVVVLGVILVLSDAQDPWPVTRRTADLGGRFRRRSDPPLELGDELGRFRGTQEDVRAIRKPRNAALAWREDHGRPGPPAT